ncbi:MAG: SAM-dependent methyltransferase [Omnitrophica WOR_2 bacterium RBG_13_44_8b]|nr:MAG: SAM-dependent methyltransferase [Omnitrophica WOR_2 bacterium RBG_13_44_8b]
MKNVFNRYYKRYDAWYERNKFTYLSELKAIRKVLPKKGKGLEIGIGTGRFASKLGISYGVDPSPNMIAFARKRGIKAEIAKGENLPFDDNTFNYILMVITLSFVPNPKKVINESKRVLKNGGRLIIGIVDKNSFLGKYYRRKKGVFYKHANLLSVPDVASLLENADFRKFIFYQTIFKKPAEIKTPEPVKKGYGQGGFVVICACNAIKGEGKSAQ